LFIEQPAADCQQALRRRYVIIIRDRWNFAITGCFLFLPRIPACFHCEMGKFTGVSGWTISLVPAA